MKRCKQIRKNKKKYKKNKNKKNYSGIENMIKLVEHIRENSYYAEFHEHLENIGTVPLPGEFND